MTCICFNPIHHTCASVHQWRLFYLWKKNTPLFLERKSSRREMKWKYLYIIYIFCIHWRYNKKNCVPIGQKVVRRPTHRRRDKHLPTRQSEWLDSFSRMLAVRSLMWCGSTVLGSQCLSNCSVRTEQPPLIIYSRMQNPATYGTIKMHAARGHESADDPPVTNC